MMKENNDKIHFMRKIMYYPYKLYKTIFIALFTPLIRKNEEVIKKIAEEQETKLKKLFIDSEEKNKELVNNLIKIEEKFERFAIETEINNKKLLHNIIKIDENIKIDKDELIENIRKLEECINIFQKQFSEYFNKEQENYSQLHNENSSIIRSISTFDDQFFVFKNKILQEVGWNRDAIYEVRDENRIHSTILQKLNEEDIVNNDKYRNEIHRHIDFTYRDIMILLRCKEGMCLKEAYVETDFPIAYDSYDTISPHGTIRDNTRCPRFVFKCEQIFIEKTALKFLDLGCSGGGMVLEALLRGHYALGLEGSDESKRQQRAEWRLIPNNLKTCDISKPFSIKDKQSDKRILFDVITAWEVLEHIPESGLGQLISNIYESMEENGIFVATIAAKTDIDPLTGIDWHKTIKPFKWWKEYFEDNGFIVNNEEFTIYDLARGVYNPPHCYEEPYDIEKANFDEDFYIVARKNVKK